MKPYTRPEPSRGRPPGSGPVLAALALVLSQAGAASAEEEWALWRETLVPPEHATRIKLPLFTERRTHLDCLYRLYRDLSHVLRTSVPPAEDVRRIEATQDGLDIWTYRQLAADGGVLQEVRFSCRPEP